MSTIDWRRCVLRALRAAAAAPVALALARCGGSPSGPGGPSPIVLAIAPAEGPFSGGTAVRISGANFAGDASVTIGGAPATDVVVESATTISARTSRAAPGNADVSVTVGGKTGTLAGAFHFLPAFGEPPVVASLVARGSRPNEPKDFADLGEEITVTATVDDPDTPFDKLQYQWSADSGTFSESGQTVKWKAPSDVSTPATVKLTLKLSDDTGNTVESSTTVVVHDSTKEVGDLAREFLLDFSDTNKSAAVVVRNFSKSPRCEGERDAEFDQIDKNRRLYRITSSSVGSPTVSFQFGARPCSYMPRDGDACVAVPATWDSVCVSSDPECTPGRAEGVDFVTAVYEQSQWKLCASYFQGRGATLRGFIR